MELSDKPIIWNYLQTTRAYTETEYDKRSIKTTRAYTETIYDKRSIVTLIAPLLPFLLETVARGFLSFLFKILPDVISTLFSALLSILVISTSDSVGFSADPA